MGYIISVFTNKGGVAKTTTAINLGHALARKGVRTLVVDIDSQCNSSEPLVGIDPENNLMDLLNGERSFEACVHPVDSQGRFFCLPNTSESVSIEPKLIREGVGGFSLLRDNLRAKCKGQFDATIIDCPPNHGIMTINALMTSDLAIVPTEAGSRNSIKGLKSALTFISDLRLDGNPELKFLKLLVTKLDSRTAIGRNYLDQLQDVFQGKIFDTVIPKNVDFQYAEDQNKTIYQSNPKAAGAKSYTRLAMEIIDLLGLTGSRLGPDNEQK